MSDNYSEVEDLLNTFVKNLTVKLNNINLEVDEIRRQLVISQENNRKLRELVKEITGINTKSKYPRISA